MQSTKIADFAFLAKKQEAAAAFNNAMAVASVGIAALKSLEELLPYAAGKVENASCNITESFKDLTRKLEESGNKDALENIAKIVVDMQFQDRNTQLMQNAVGILVSYRALLEELHRTLETISSGNQASDINIAHAVQTILSGICLSDVRTNFMAALTSAKVGYTHEESSPITKLHLTESIELF